MRKRALFFAALADENRLRLLYLIKDAEICVCHLQDVLQTNQPKISRHLAYLRRTGLVAARREGKWMYYSLNKLTLSDQKLLSTILAALKNEPQIKKDRQRAQDFAGCET